MEWMFSRAFVVTLALTGGALSLTAIWLRQRQGAPQQAASVPEMQGTAKWAARLDAVSYGFMGVSMLLFIITGLRGPQS